MLLESSRSLLEVSHELGLSGSSRLHDHFAQLEAVTPGEYKSRGKQVHIECDVHATPLGPMFVVVTRYGVCRAGALAYSAPLISVVLLILAGYGEATIAVLSASVLIVLGSLIAGWAKPREVPRRN